MTSNTTRELLNYLKDNNGFITSEELAIKFNVSKKTIQRQIKRINDAANEIVIKSEKGRGYQLDYNNYLYKKEHFNNGNSNELNEWQLDILKELLFCSPSYIGLDDLINKYYLSESSLHIGLRRIEMVLSNYDLVVSIKNRHVQIAGSEKDIRDALIDLVLNFDIDTFGESQNKFNRDPDIVFAMKQKIFAENVLKSTIPYPYNINLFTHIFILLNRTRRYVKLSIDDKTIKSLNQQISEYPEIYSVCVEILNNIDNYLHIKVSKNETYYLFEYLISSRLDSMNINKCDDILVNKITEMYISIVSERFGIKISKGSLFSELFQHILPMVNRLRHNIRLNNVLLDEIRNEYGDLLKSVEYASIKIGELLDLPDISENESGFITLYFAKYLEENNDQIRALVVCTTGIGTSELVATKIKKYFPEIHIVNVISSFDLEDTIKHNPNIDFLISTVPLNNKYKIPIAIVSPLFSLRDKSKVQNILGTFQIKDKGVEFIELPLPMGLQSKRDVINSVSRELSNRTNVNRDLIESAIDKRESIGNTTVTNGIVLLHCILDKKVSNYAGISVLDSPIDDWKCLDGTSVRIIVSLFLSKDNVKNRNMMKPITVFTSNLANEAFVNKFSNIRDTRSAIKFIKENLEESQC